jgi:hypothetical protein
VNVENHVCLDGIIGSLEASSRRTVLISADAVFATKLLDPFCSDLLGNTDDPSEICGLGSDGASHQWRDLPLEVTPVVLLLGVAVALGLASGARCSPRRHHSPESSGTRSAPVIETGSLARMIATPTRAHLGLSRTI